MRLQCFSQKYQMVEAVVGGAYPIRLEPSSLVNPASIFKEKHLEAVSLFYPTVQCYDVPEY